MGLLGFFVGITCILAAQLISGGSLLALLDGPAFLIVFGGTLGATMLQTPRSDFRSAYQQRDWVIHTPPSKLHYQAERFVKWAVASRQHGLLSLEDVANKEPCEYTRMGLDLLIDGTDNDQLKQLMEAETDIEQDRLERGARVFEAMGGFSPTIGIIGAVLGLIQAMGNLSNPSELGQGIAIAFVATIYGVGFANLIYIPIANKLRATHYQLFLYQELTMQGLLALGQGENALQIKQRLQVYLRE